MLWVAWWHMQQVHLCAHRLGTHHCMCSTDSCPVAVHDWVRSSVFADFSRDLQNCAIHCNCVGVCRFSPRAKSINVGILAQASKTTMQIRACQDIWVLQQPQSKLHVLCSKVYYVCTCLCWQSWHADEHKKRACARSFIESVRLTKQYYNRTPATGLDVKRWKTTATHTESLAQYLLIRYESPCLLTCLATGTTKSYDLVWLHFWVS